MDDAEYALVADLTRLRAALDVLRACCPDDTAIRDAVAILSERERELSEQVADIIGQGPAEQPW
jgi:hypothetical protein